MRTTRCSLVILTAALLIGAGVAWAEADKALAIDVAKVADKQLAPDVWGEAQEVEGKTFRVARGGKEAWLQTEAWWKDGLRPAEGQYWLAEIVYKDTAKQPIRFSVFAGVAAHEGRTEMHRFGGLADGQWKTAKVPLPWDMLMVRPGTRLVEFGFRSPEGDVPVASIKVAPLAKQDLAKAAEQWNAETREWIARVQKRHADKGRAEVAAAQKPTEAVAESDKAVVPYVRSWMQVVYPYSAPQKGEADEPLKARMALNEYEPAAFGVYANGKDLTHVRVTVTPLKRADGEGTLEAGVRAAEYALVPSGKAYGAFPQRLWPMYPTSIKKGESGWFWLTFQSDPAKTKPGVYRGQVKVAAEEGSATLAVEVRVLPIRLLAMNETDLRMGGCITGLVARHDMDEMVRHNHNLVQFWFSGVAPRFVVTEKGKFTLDFTILDDVFEQAKKAGIVGNVFFLGGNPYNFPSTHTLARELAKQVLGMSMDEYLALIQEDPFNMPDEIAPLYKEWVRQYMAHAKAKGWPEQILTPFDEPDKWRQRRDKTGPWIRPQFEQACKLIHEGWPDTRVYISAHHAPATLFLPVVDIFCTNAIGEDQQLGDKVRADKKVFWQYSGTGVASPPDRARYTFGFYFNAYDSRGSLCWAYNWYNDGFDNTEGDNWGYAWYTPLDVIPAPSYEGLREAWDDRRYVETLKKIAKDKKADISELLDALAKAALEQRGKGGQDTVDDFWDQAKQVGIMDELRGRVIAKILDLQKAEPEAP